MPIGGAVLFIFTVQWSSLFIACCPLLHCSFAALCCIALLTKRERLTFQFTKFEMTSLIVAPPCIEQSRYYAAYLFVNKRVTDGPPFNLQNPIDLINQALMHPYFTLDTELKNYVYYFHGIGDLSLLLKTFINRCTVYLSPICLLCFSFFFSLSLLSFLFLSLLSLPGAPLPQWHFGHCIVHPCQPLVAPLNIPSNNTILI